MIHNIKKHHPSTIILLPLIMLFAFALFMGCGSENENGTVPKEQVYYCPMHPEVQSDKPGVCPICHMDLVLKGSDDTMDEQLNGVVSLNDNKLVLANVSTIKVVKEKLNNVISSYSYLDFAEQNRKLVTARFDGRIEKLFVDKTGNYVKQGEALFEIYSPDLVQAQNDYLIALESNENISTASYSGNKDDSPLLKSAEKKLRLFGITKAQIDELQKTREPKLTITYFSPMNGTVIEKKIQEGMYVNEGSIIYDIADLSTLWNISEVYENDLGQIKEGSKIKLSFQAYPGETFEGKVSLIYPVVNPQSRTVKVRSIVRNKEKKLKPNMYGETRFENNLNETLVIPEDAVLFTGERKLVYVKVDNGKFSVREIEIGYKSGNKYQVLSGLNEGEEVAATGAYLIDSESQLKTGNSSVHQHGGDKPNKIKETDHSQHSSEEMKEKKNNIIHERDVKVSSLDKNKDGYVYQCPMDWQVISDKPGTCPLCKMDLEKFSVKEAQKNLDEYR